MKTRDEIFENYIKILAAEEDAKSTVPMSLEEYRELEKGNYSTSGESEFEWSPGEPDEKDDGDAPGYRYHPEEKVYRGPRREGDPLKGRYSKKPKEEPVVEDLGEAKPETEKPSIDETELLRQIKREPEHLVTNLMIQRDPEFSKDYKKMYLLLDSLYKWMVDTGIDPEPGTMLFEEAKYMADKTNELIEAKNKELDEKSATRASVVKTLYKIANELDDSGDDDVVSLVDDALRVIIKNINGEKE